MTTVPQPLYSPDTAQIITLRSTLKENKWINNFLSKLLDLFWVPLRKYCKKKIGLKKCITIDIDNKYY